MLEGHQPGSGKGQMWKEAGSSGRTKGPREEMRGSGAAARATIAECHSLGAAAVPHE